MSAQLPENVKKMRFLVTDDYESMRIMIGAHLKELGVQHIAFCASGNEAVAFVKSKFGTPEAIDFILTDLAMENGTGIDLVKALRAEANFKKLPVLMITSKSDVSLVIEAARAGVNNYIIKPWQVDEFMKKIVDTLTKVS